ncbi:MAG: glucose-1-phosphate thymidylyltransferase RfbA [Alphaproteobacteria bacterium]|nr:glucose-1-phosphate thymidylyltransferase RfbA [Alphaproteobacteria bacterium]MDZ4762528.1 glucose-1-phosphate thymidylyltransferase RfbA [Alphaproteobacteria bacterium]
MARKGIVLAGGSGTRLYPITKATIKQLLPIYNKPLIYYPISTLMMSGIREILLITTPRDASAFWDLLGDGSRFGVDLNYAVQPSPDGLAQAFIIGRDFIGDDPSCLILGDNIFHGHGLEDDLASASLGTTGGSVFIYHVDNPERYGVVEFDGSGRPIRIHEKPPEFKSSYAVTGLYFYDNQVLDIAASLKPSLRGELEITDVNQVYLDRGQLDCVKFGRGCAWLDAGTPDSLLEAAQFVHTIERRQGQRIACLEEIAVRKGYISLEQFERDAGAIAKSDYGAYLLKVATELALPVLG